MNQENTALHQRNTVLFDFDGTVFDTVEGITKCVQYAIRKHGWDAELNELRCFAGPPLSEKFMEVYGVLREEAEELVTDFRERYVPIGVYESSPFPGIQELLETLRAAGKKTAIATSKPQALAELLLERAKLRDIFDVVVGSGGGVNNDAKWQIVTRAMKLCGSKPENCVLVGDTKYDVEGAKKCGIPCIGVRWGYAAEGELEATGAAAMVETPKELAVLLCGMREE